MADYKYPKDGTLTGGEPLITNKAIPFPDKRMAEGTHRTFELLIIGATAKDAGVTFKFYGGLDEDVLDASNIAEITTTVALTGLIGKLVFKKEISNSLDTAFKVAIGGTDPASTATFILRGRSF